VKPDELDLRTGAAIGAGAVAIHYLASMTAIGWSAPPGTSTIAGQLAGVIVIALAVPPDRARRLGLVAPPLRFVIAAILVGLTTWRALSWTTRPFIAWFGVPRAGVFDDSSLVITVGVVGLLPGICEELLFRGVLVRSFATRWSWPRAMVLSSLAFALYHHSPYQLVAPFLDGLILGYLTLRSGSIVPAMIAHALHNTMISLHRALVPWPMWRWIDGHYDQTLGAMALIAFAGVIVATRGEPTR
jgi:membrane protease YdiL (CAAX protease family)